MVTAEVKKGLTYYHCTNSRRICDKKGVRQEMLDEQVERVLQKIHLNPEIEDLLLEVIDRFESSPMLELQAQYKQVSQQLIACEEQLGELVLMRARRLIDDIALTQGQERLKGEIVVLRKSMRTLQSQLDRKHESVLNAIDFASHVVEKFKSADTWEKRRIIQVLGGSYVLTEKRLKLEKHPLLEYIAENRGAIEQEILGYQKQKKGLQNPSIPFGGTNGTLTELFRLGALHNFPQALWEV
jgi:hypothetical protein